MSFRPEALTSTNAAPALFSHMSMQDSITEIIRSNLYTMFCCKEPRQRIRLTVSITFGVESQFWGYEKLPVEAGMKRELNEPGSHRNLENWPRQMVFSMHPLLLTYISTVLQFGTSLQISIRRFLESSADLLDETDIDTMCPEPHADPVQLPSLGQYHDTSTKSLLLVGLRSRMKDLRLGSCWRCFLMKKNVSRHRMMWKGLQTICF